MSTSAELPENRIRLFTEEYKKLIDKYKVDMVTIPVYVPAAGGQWVTMLQARPMDISILEESVKSPFNEPPATS